MSLVKRNSDFFRNRKITIMSKETTPSDPDHEHYPWGASNSKTWIYCSGSINYVDEQRALGNIPEDREEDTPEWTKEGTRAHDFADQCNKGEISRDDIPSEYYEHLEGYLDLMEELEESNGGQKFNEQKVELFYAPGHYGTLDFSVATEEEVCILDLKYGVGVYVPAKENTQAAIYAISLVRQLEAQGWEFTDDTIVKMFIYQPRHRDFTGEPELWRINLRELLDMAIDIEDYYKISRDAATDDLTPGKEQCQFCPGRRSGVCKAMVMDLFEDVPDELNPLTGPVTLTKEFAGDVTDEALVRIFEKHREISSFMDSLMKNALKLIEQGREIPGLKVVLGKPGNRKWGENEEAAEKLLRKIPTAQRFKRRTVISPAQAEKVLAKIDKEAKKEDPEAKSVRSTRFDTRFESLIVRNPPKPVLASEDDERPAIASTFETFEEVEDLNEDGAEACF
jgi:hypothetical protein